MSLQVSNWFQPQGSCHLDWCQPLMSQSDGRLTDIWDEEGDYVFPHPSDMYPWLWQRARERVCKPNHANSDKLLFSSHAQHIGQSKSQGQTQSQRAEQISPLTIGKHHKVVWQRTWIQEDIKNRVL